MASCLVHVLPVFNGKLAHFSKALNNEGLTYEAKGMLLYLYSLEDINYVSMPKLIENGASGRDKTRRIFKELVNKGFVNKYLERDNKGRFSHDIFYLNERKIELNNSETK
jgi:predicted GNAT superfamily acetyltransferase